MDEEPLKPKSTVYIEGYNAAKAFDIHSMPESKNPYDKGTVNHKDWITGWADYFRKRKEREKEGRILPEKD